MLVDGTSRAQERPAAWKTGLGMATVAAIASFAPSMYPRANWQQAVMTGVAAAAGFGIGTALDAIANQVDSHTGLDPAGSRLTIAGIAGAGLVGANLALRGSSSLAAHGIRSASLVVGATALMGAGLIGEQWLADRVAPHVTGGEATAHVVLLGGATIGAAALILGRTRASAVSPEQAEAYARTMTAGVPDTTVPFDEAAHGRLQELRAGMTTISGGPDSLLPREPISPSGVRFLGEATPAAEIERVLDLAPGSATEPIRIWDGIQHGATVEERADLIFQEAKRMGAFEREHVVLFAPTGSGYIYPQTIASGEYVTKGNIASIAMQWNDKASAQSYGKVPDATKLFDQVIQKFTDHIATLPDGSRPRLTMSGDSLGGKALHNVFAGHGGTGIEARGVDAVFTVGNSRNGAFRLETLGAEGHGFDVTGKVFEMDHPSQLAALPAEQKEQVRAFLLSHHNDPLGKVTPHLLFERPDWLTKVDNGIGVPAKMKWMPGVTGLHGLGDMWNGANLKPGDFTRVGHDYRADMAPLVNEVLRADTPAPTMSRIQDALVQLELARKHVPLIGEV